MNEHVDYQAKSAGSSTKFLWWCAGADPLILKYSSYSDHVKYAGIGGVVLATGFLASLSMGFAMHTVFGDDQGNGNWFITLPIAIVWGLIVFNLDRFIVSSTGKGDGESSISWKEFVNALPRLVMATLLGITIAAPLETYIFHTEIDREWKLSMDQLALSKSYEVLQAEIEKDLKNQENSRKKKEEVDKQRDIWSRSYQAWEDQMQGRAGAEAGIGPRTKALKEVEIQEKEKLEILEAEFKSLEEIRIKNESEISKKQEDAMNEVKSSLPGFLDKLMMLERLSAHGKTVPKFDPVTNTLIPGAEEEIYGAAFWPIWLVRLLFMIVEIAPVLLKLMLIKGPYDYMSENVNQILETKQGISIYHMKDEHAQLHKLKRNHNPERIISIIEHQNEKETENAKEAIDAFADKEKEEIRKNPDDFIKPIS